MCEGPWVSAHYIILPGQAGPEVISRREVQLFLTLRNPIFLNGHTKYGGGNVGGRNLRYVKQTHRSNQEHKYSARLNHGCDAFFVPELGEKDVTHLPSSD